MAVNKAMPIMIVEDFAPMRKIIEASLLKMGFTNIIEAEDGNKAWEQLSNHDFGLIISDWSMPGLSGMELLQKMRSDNKFKTIPFIMIASEGKKEHIIAAVKAGVSNYVIKPFNTNSLKTKICAVIGDF